MSRAGSAFEAGRYDEARALYEIVLEHNPRDATAHYNLACSFAQLGDADAGAEALTNAVRFGFTRFFDMARDQTLAPIRGHELYERIVENIPEILDARGEAEFTMLTEKTSKKYTTVRDAGLRLNFASAADSESLAFAREEIARVAAWTEAQLFELPRDTERDPWVAVILPTPEDFVRLVRGARSLGGFYDRDNRRLVTQDTGPSLRHEFFHVLHWRHQERLGQEHAYWIAEGLAALLEDVEIDEHGEFVIVPSWRTNIAQRLARSTRFPSIKRIASLDRATYMGSRASANYAVARSLFMFLNEQGKLGAWYAAYTEGFEQDPTGVAALESVLGRPVREIDRVFRMWVLELEQVGEQRRPGSVGLGVEIKAGRGSGPVVSVSIRNWKRGVTTGLRSRDIIKAIDGRDVRSIDDYYRILGGYKAGRTVAVRIVRGKSEMDVPVKLVR